MGLDDRKLDVLRAIVEDYVATQEPVGSKALVERHQLGSPRPPSATTWPCWRRRATSASRTPAPAGCPPTGATGSSSTGSPGSSRSRPAERRAIERFLVGAVDLDDVVHRTVRLLAQLTRQVAVVQYPSLARSAVRHLELVPISTTRLMLVMITDTGRVEQRLVELPGADPRRRRHRAAPAGQREARRQLAVARPRRWCRRWSRRSAPQLRGADDHARHRAAGDAGRAAPRSGSRWPARPTSPGVACSTSRARCGRSWRRSRRRSSCSS